MKPTEIKVITAAIKWWKSKRPVVFNEKQHLENPGINCTGSENEKRLAEAVGKLIISAK